MNGDIVPDLVKVFYTNLTFEKENVASHVKGVDIKITPVMWIVVTGLKYSGAKVGKGNISAIAILCKVSQKSRCSNQRSSCRCTQSGRKCSSLHHSVDTQGE